jgi:hypothetical protein
MRRTLKEIGWALAYVVTAALCFHGGVAAQEDDSGEAGASAGLVRSYHLNQSGYGSSDLCGTSIGCPTVGIWFQQAVAATLTPDIGPTYVMTVNGNPTRVAAPVWPAGLTTPGYSWRMDGTGDYLSIADDPAFEVADFSVFVCFVPMAPQGANEALIAKYNGGANKRQWTLNATSGTGYALYISDDGTSAGGHLSALSKAAGTALNRLSCVTATYKSTGYADGSCVAYIYADETAAATSAAMDLLWSGGDADFTISAQPGAVNDGPFDFFVAAYYPGVLTAADHARLNRRFRGLYDSSLSNVVAVVAATMPSLLLAPPASGVSPFLVDQPANQFGVGAVAAGMGGVTATAAITNICQRSSFATALTGWTETATSTGDCANSVVQAAHGSASARCTNADNDDAISMTGACLTVAGNTAYNLSAWAVLVSGTGLLDLTLVEDDSADCATPTTTTVVVNDAVPTATWARYDGAITTQAGTIRAQVRLTLPAAAAQVTDLDAVMLVAGAAAPLGYCGADTDASAVCSAVIASTASPLKSAGSWTLQGKWTQVVDGSNATVKYLLHIPGTAGNNNRITISHASDVLTCDVYDAAGAQKTSTVAAAIAVSEEWDFRCVHTDAGLVTACAKVATGATWACDATPATAAITVIPSTTMNIGSDGTTPGNVAVRDVQFFRRAVAP